MMMNKRCALLLFVIAGCAGPRVAGPHLSVYVQALQEGERIAREISPGGSLRSGDRFAPGVFLSDTRGGYVYALLRSGGREPAQIFPAAPAAQAQLPPGKDTLLTQGADFFHLDQVPGKEILYVVYAPAPLDAAAALAAVYASDQGLGKDREPPPIIDRKDRGRIQVPLRPDGPTVARFPFVHQ